MSLCVSENKIKEKLQILRRKTLNYLDLSKEEIVENQTLILIKVNTYFPCKIMKFTLLYLSCRYTTNLVIRGLTMYIIVNFFCKSKLEWTVVGDD